MTEKLLNGCLKGSKVVEPKADYDECAIWSETLWSGIISLKFGCSHGRRHWRGEVHYNSSCNTKQTDKRPLAQRWFIHIWIVKSTENTLAASAVGCTMSFAMILTFIPDIIDSTTEHNQRASFRQGGPRAYAWGWWSRDCSAGIKWPKLWEIVQEPIMWRWWIAWKVDAY